MMTDKRSAEKTVRDNRRATRRHLNQYMHIWAFENAGDREQKRAAMWADPDWLKYTKEAAKLGALEKQKNSLWSPIAFFAEWMAQR